MSKSKPIPPSISDAEMRAHIEAVERAENEKFLAELNTLCQRHKRRLVAVPQLVSSEGGMKISAQIAIERVTTQ